VISITSYDIVGQSAPSCAFAAGAATAAVCSLPVIVVR